MVDNLLCFKKNVHIIEKNKLKEKEITIAIELKEMLNDSDLINVILQINGENIKEIEIRRR